MDYQSLHARTPSGAGAARRSSRSAGRNGCSGMENYKPEDRRLCWRPWPRQPATSRTYTERAQVASTVESKRAELERLGIGSQLNRSAGHRPAAERCRQGLQAAAADREDPLPATWPRCVPTRAAYDQDWHAKVSQELTDQSRKLDEAQGNLTKADDAFPAWWRYAPTRMPWCSVMAPVSVGSVLQTGDQFIKLVPLGAPLEVEASVSGSDAGFVHVGDKVTIKFDTFPVRPVRRGGGNSPRGQPGQLHGNPQQGRPDGPRQPSRRVRRLRRARQRTTASGCQHRPGQPARHAVGASA